MPPGALHASCRADGRPTPSPLLKKKDPHDHKDQTQQENKDGEAVDPMHIPHPLSVRRFRVPLFDVKIFAKLSPDSHRFADCGLKVNNTPDFELFKSKSSIFALPKSPPNGKGLGDRKGD
jgi:hypothetical protein